ncbi:MAG: class I SAM-dependent methyltransferase [Burkholderiales bacterium]|nr:class I SAM-dependent methyltransferase [Burkholderiales bacterium]
MSPLAESLLQRYYADAVHPYRLFERTVDALVREDSVLLDAGCGRTVPVLRKYLDRARTLIGVDLVEFTDVPVGIRTYKADLARMPVAGGSVDVVMSRSVFEHLVEPDRVYAELGRVLRPGGHVVFLTANMWDYGTLVARSIPNRFHGRIVARVEGRDETDTFPTAYRTNTRRAITRLAAAHGMTVESFRYVSQYPNYLLFNGALFFVGVCYEKLISRFDALAFLRGWLLVTLRKAA